MSVDDGSMSGFVSDALTRLRKASSRKHKSLRRAIGQVLDHIGKLGAEQLSEDNNADKYFLPFKLACETETSKMMEISLDCIQKLIAYGYLRGSTLVDPHVFPPSRKPGDAPPEPPPPARPANELPGPGHVRQPSDIKAQLRHRRRLIDVIIETIYECSMYDNDKVQLQVIKALLTAVTSVTCKVHAHSLLLAVRACYHIFLTSRNMVNRTTAKATLTQMLNIVFQRMEHFAGQLKEHSDDSENEGDEHDPLAANPVHGENEPSYKEKNRDHGVDVSSQPNVHGSNGDGGNAAAAAAAAADNDGGGNDDDDGTAVAPSDADDAGTSAVATADVGANVAPSDADAPVATQEISDVADSAAAAADDDDDDGDDRDGDDGDGTTTAPNAPSTPPQRAPAAAVAVAAAPDVPPTSPAGKYGHCIVCGAPANNYCLQTRDPVCSVECKVAHFDDIINQPDPSASVFSIRTTIAAKYALLQNDCYLLFRALCKLSTKVIPNPPEPIALASKTLSLELLYSILDKPGPTFRNADIFVDLVRENLVDSLLQNLVTSLEPVFHLSSSIFVTLIANYKPHLKTEIGVFLDNIFLKILATPHSTYAHKKMALKVISKLCQDSQTIVELFLNYDCELHNFDIFQTIVAHLEKVAQGRFVMRNWISDEQDAALRRWALECFGHIMKSLVIWAQRARHVEEESARSGHESDSDAEVTLSPSPAWQGGRRLGDGSGAGEQRLAGTGGGGNDSSTTLSAPSRGHQDGSDSPLDPPPTSSASSSPMPDHESSRPAFSEQYIMLQDQRRKLETGIVRFNLDPKKGVSYLREHGIIDDSPISMARFLMANSRTLDKTVVGDFLGGHKEFPKQVLYAYVDLIDFTGLSFDDGIRRFLSTFRLPGEAQKIDRMMEKFADAYCQHNPDVFSSADTAYVLAYAVIMLNTDAHSDQIKNKMTKEEFIRNNRGISTVDIGVVSRVDAVRRGAAFQ